MCLSTPFMELKFLAYLRRMKARTYIVHPYVHGRLSEVDEAFEGEA